MKLIDAISNIADAAKMERRPPPEIITDVYSALKLAEMIEAELGGSIRGYRHSEPRDYVVMFDGVKIKSKNQATTSGFREYFGELAENLG